MASRCYRAVAAMHSWPYILGIHHFMMRLALSMVIFQNKGIDTLFPFISVEDQVNSIESKLIAKFVGLSFKNYQVDQTEAEQEQKQRVIETEILQEAGLTSDIMDEIRLLEEKVASHQKRVLSLEKKYQTLNDQVKSWKQMNQEVDNKIELEEENINKLKEKLQHFHFTLQDLQKECHSLECELIPKEETKVKLQEHQEQDKEIMKEIKKTEERKQLLQKDIAYENEYIKKYENEVYNVDLKLADVQKKIKNIEKEYNDKILKMMKVVNGVKEAVIHDQPQNTSPDCFAKVSAILSEVKSSLSIDINEFSNKLSCLIGQNEKKQTELKKINESLISKSEELEQLKLKLLDLGIKKQEVFEKLQDLNSKKISLEVKMEENRAKKERLTKKLSICRELNKGRSDKLEKIKCVLKRKLEISNLILQEMRESSQKAIDNTLKK